MKTQKQKPNYSTNYKGISIILLWCHALSPLFSCKSLISVVLVWVTQGFSLSLSLFLKLYNTIFFLIIIHLVKQCSQKSSYKWDYSVFFFFLRCLESKQTHLCPSRERESVVFGQLIEKRRRRGRLQLWILYFQLPEVFVDTLAE